MPTPRLYAHPFSSYCQKVIMAFYEKDEPFEMRPLAPDNPDAATELNALWPIERFPVLVAEGRTIVESTAIIEWLEIHTPHAPTLIPAEAEAALEVRMRDRIFDNYVMTPMQKIVFDRIRAPEVRDPYGVDQARTLLDRAYGWLDAEAKKHEWAAGSAFSMADCAAAPALFYANWVHPFDGHRHLTAYYRRLRDRPSFARAVEEARPYRAYFPGGVPAHAD